MRITVVCPILNEIFFIKGWYECVSKFADEIIVVDTGSTDGSLEWLEKKAHTDRRILVHKWHTTYRPYMWEEWKIRNFLLETSSGDWILTLDADELVDDEFIEFLNILPSVKWHIGRMLEYLFWGDINHIRAKSWWPPIRIGKTDKRIDFTLFPSRRGLFPSHKPRLVRRSETVSYTKKNNHCILQVNNLGRLTYRNPSLYKDLDIPVYHYHFAFPVAKENENRWFERGKKLKTLEYRGNHPLEIKYYGS